MFIKIYFKDKVGLLRQIQVIKIALPELCKDTRFAVLKETLKP